MATNIASIIPSIQAVGLASYNVRKLDGKKVNTKDILNMGVTNIVGVSLIKTTAGLV